MSRLARRRVDRTTDTGPGPPADAEITGRRYGPGLRRHPGDAVRIGLAAAAVAATAVFVHRDRVAVLEIDVFRVANDLPGWMFPLFWAVMQLGNFLAVPLVAAAAALTRRFRLAVEILVTGTGVWLLAKAVKRLVERGRPEDFVAGVHTHGAPATGLGYPSGHAAVIAAMATLIIPYLGRRSRRVAVSCIVIVCVARMYVGAHLPLDVIAGAALGWGVASAVHLALGAPSGRPRTADVARALTGLGYPPASITALGLDARRSALFRVVSTCGQRLFVKVIPRERRDRDVLYRLWRSVGHRRSRHPPERQGRDALEHEALMAAQAARAGVRVPAVLSVGDSRHGAAILVQEWVEGDRLGWHSPTSDPGGAPRLLADAWRQVAGLHRNRIAHGALSTGHLLVDDQERVHLVGFGEARMAPGDGDLVADVADLLVVTAALAGAEPAVTEACAQVGSVRVVAAVDLLRTGEGRRRARALLGREPGAAGQDGVDALTPAVESYR